MLRHATLEDAARCAEIYLPYVRDGVASLEDVPPEPEEMAVRMGSVMETHPWLVAERDKQVAGYAYATRHRERAAYRWATDVTVYVAAEHHRQGLGRELYLRLFEILRRHGLQVACAGITLPNEASVGLHEALGFAPVGIYRRVGWKLGSWWDVGWWQLDLVPPGSGRPAEPRFPAR
jgi:L-amino acid N-acyltransferase YncA